MDYELVGCILELTALVCYGFLILVLVFYWPNEANVYLALFCLSNATLAAVGAFGAMRDGIHCQTNGFLTMLAVTFGTETLYRNQIERKRMGRHQFRLYRPRPQIAKVVRSCISSTVVALVALQFYRHSPNLRICFLRASTTAKLQETLVSFLWILYFYLRPLVMTVKDCPAVLVDCYRQSVALAHEKDLGIDGQLFLFKDHHRRLYSTLCSMVSQINLLLWLILTTPYLIQVFSLVAGLQEALQLEDISKPNAVLLITFRRSLPILNCIALLAAMAAFLTKRLPKRVPALRRS